MKDERLFSCHVAASSCLGSLLFEACEQSVEVLLDYVDGAFVVNLEKVGGCRGYLLRELRPPACSF